MLSRAIRTRWAASAAASVFRNERRSEAVSPSDTVRMMSASVQARSDSSSVRPRSDSCFGPRPVPHSDSRSVSHSGPRPVSHSGPRPVSHSGTCPDMRPDPRCGPGSDSRFGSRLGLRFQPRSPSPPGFTPPRRRAVRCPSLNTLPPHRWLTAPASSTRNPRAIDHRRSASAARARRPRPGTVRRPPGQHRVRCRRPWMQQSFHRRVSAAGVRGCDSRLSAARPRANGGRKGGLPGRMREWSRRSTPRPARRSRGLTPPRPTIYRRDTWTPRSTSPSSGPAPPARWPPGGWPARG